MDPLLRTRVPPGFRTKPRRLEIRGHEPRGLAPTVIDGCCIEAERADTVRFHLEGLRIAIPEPLHPHLAAIIEHLRITSQHLRDIADKSQVHLAQVPAMIDYLNIILPCLSRTLRDIMSYYEDKSMTKAYRWRTMYHAMGRELPGTSLPARFVMYNQFLELLNFLMMRYVPRAGADHGARPSLTLSPNRDPSFDVNTMEALRGRILQLRAARQIDPPTPTQTDLVRRDTALDFWQRETDFHWAEAIFTQPLPSRREFRHRAVSLANGPLTVQGQTEPMYGDCKILIKRPSGTKTNGETEGSSFDEDRISVVVFLRQDDQEPFILIRNRSNTIENWIDIRPVRDLTIERRSRDSAVNLYVFDHAYRKYKEWARLSFVTWEELVLFYCTFVSLKMRTDTVVSDLEYMVGKEKLLFRSTILDNGYQHSLAVAVDTVTGGQRLHTVVLEGPLAGCPIWTAFIPPDFSERNLSHKSPRRIWLRNIHIYSFSDEYRPHKQRKGRSAAFELRFNDVRTATIFKQIFNPISPPSVDEASEDA
ncbi:hypothetical protein GGS20DRAFT_583444 [Poronia punctata]|nr:hypothetical protein GGS20DRAFT_583444 [Poronia punctata]